MKPQSPSFTRAPFVQGLRLTHFLTVPLETKNRTVAIPPTSTTMVPVIESKHIALLEMTFSDEQARTPFFSFLPMAIITRQVVGGVTKNVTELYEAVQNPTPGGSGTCQRQTNLIDGVESGAVITCP